MAKIKITPWNTAETLVSPEDISGYLAAAFDEGDPALIRIALANVAKARNMTQLAADMGISRSGLRKALSPEGNPKFWTIQKFISAVGAKLTIVVDDNKHKPKIRKSIAQKK